MKNFVFHIGYHKTATTWLQGSYFSKHPQINLASNCNEPWRDPLLSILIGSTIRSFSEAACARALMAVNIPDKRVNLVSAERLSGHPYSGGYDSFTIANRIHACSPDSKIIIVVRNQLDMIRSIYKQLVKQGYLGEFKDLVKGESWKGTSFKPDFLKYDLIVGKYYELFGSDQVMVATYESILSDNHRFISALNKFLGVDEFQLDRSEEKFNVSLPDHEIAAYRIANKFKTSEMNPFPAFVLGERRFKLLHRSLCWYFKMKEPRLFEDNILRELADYYQQSNLNLGQLIRDPLTGYP